MAYCMDELGDFAVTPMLVAPCGPENFCQPPPLCYPCLPSCPASKVVYYCEKPESKSSKSSDNCCREKPKRSVPREECCPTCKQAMPYNIQPTPIKTKYVIPCYRYEDGRIEQYVPTRHGRLPMSAYRRNGIQDQIYGYRGAQRYLCAGGTNSECRVFTAVEPLRKIFPKVTQEMLAVRRKKDKK